MNDEDNLFGLPGAEHLQSTEVDVYECEIDGWTTGDPGEVWIIEEWTVGAVKFGPSTAEMMAEDAHERLCDDGLGDDGFCENVSNAAGHPDVVAAFQEALDLLCSKVTYRMADMKVAEHRVTFDANHEPLLNGEPMYVPVPKESA